MTPGARPIEHLDDELDAQKFLRVKSEAFGQTFIFKRLTARERKKADDMAWEWADGETHKLSQITQIIFNYASTLQIALVSPQGYSFIDQEDAEDAILDLHKEYQEWRAVFRKPAGDRLGKAGGATGQDA